MLTVNQVAVICEVKPVTVRAWIAAGKLSRQPCGRISNEDILEWWEERRNTPMAELQNRRWRRIA